MCHLDRQVQAFLLCHRQSLTAGGTKTLQEEPVTELLYKSSFMSYTEVEKEKEKKHDYVCYLLSGLDGALRLLHSGCYYMNN